MTIRRLVGAVLALGLVALSAGSASAEAAPAKAAPAAKVSLNSATVDQLAAVPGVGPKLAARIVEQRQKSGGFKSVEDILSVKGIGEKSFAKMQPHLTLGEAPRPAAAK
jgi:competence protein ComEA